MPYDVDDAADNFIQEHGREAIGTAFCLAAKCFENHDSDGYERYFRIYVRLAQRSGMATTLFACHEQMSRQKSESNMTPAGDQFRSG